MLSTTLEEVDGELVTLAVIVTVLPAGRNTGAVYTMLMLLPTYAGAIVPQGFAGCGVIELPRQNTVQLTPRFSLSAATPTLTFACALVATWVNCTVLLFGSVTEIAPSCGPFALPHPAIAITSISNNPALAHSTERRARE